MRRVITLFILIILCFLLQTTAFSFHDITGSAPNLMLVLTMSFGLMRGRKEGMLVGFFCGFLYDCFLGTLIGPYMLLYMFTGYVNGFFHKNYQVEDVMLPVIIIVLDEIVFNLLIYVFSFVLRNRLDFTFYLTKVILPQILYTLLATIILYRIFVRINKYLKKKAKD